VACLRRRAPRSGRPSSPRESPSPGAGRGRASLLGTTKRKDGKLEVTLQGAPALLLRHGHEAGSDDGPRRQPVRRPVVGFSHLQARRSTMASATDPRHPHSGDHGRPERCGRLPARGAQPAGRSSARLPAISVPFSILLVGSSSRPASTTTPTSRWSRRSVRSSCSAFVGCGRRPGSP